VVFDTTGLGGTAVEFEAQFTPGAPDQCSGAWSANKSPKATLTIEDASCPSPGEVYVGASYVAGDGIPTSPYSGNWSFRITVINCTGKPLTNVKVQGGSNGWTSLLGGPIATSGAVSVTSKAKGAQTITWWVDLPNDTPQSLTITVMGSIPGGQCGTTRYVSGAWSAAYLDPDTLLQTKSEYSGRVSLEVCGLP
jgi:hypothetical protein